MHDAGFYALHYSTLVSYAVIIRNYSYPPPPPPHHAMMMMMSQYYRR
jgi:hypothetical protein